MRKMKGGLALLSAAVMTISVLGSAMVSALPVKAAATVSNPRIADDGTVTWDKITFGSYPQEAEFSPEPIKWRILDMDEVGNAFLIADKALDCKPFNTEYGDCTWETCSLRDWLNGIDEYSNDNNAFINAAFSADERNAITNTIVDNSSDEYNKAGGNNTVDKVYLLSYKEADAYGFLSRGAITQVTDFAKIKGYNQSLGKYGEGCEWWLRSLTEWSQPWCGGNGGACAGVNGNEDMVPVLPVLHVNINNTFVKDAGKVTSEGKVEESLNRTSYNQFSKPTVVDDVTTWDCVFFGNYKQNATFEKKPIEWRVLSVDSDNAFVIADKGLDCKQYNNKYEESTWETSNLREWLNGTNKYEGDKDAFINAAFTADEQTTIISTNVLNENNPDRGTTGGNNTNDKVFLLSMSDVTSSIYGFDTQYKTQYEYFSSDTRQQEPTDYARINGVGNGCDWWLRSPGGDSNDAMIVWKEGYIHYSRVDFQHNTVRPVLYVDLSTAYVSNAGTVSAKSDMTVEKRSAAKVVDIISLIGTVTKDSKAKIEEARLAYNALSDVAKAKVSNYSILENAEKKYAELLKDESSKGVVTSQEPVVVATTEQSIIAPDKVKITFVKNIKKKSIVIKWKKASDTKGYEIQYALNKKFTKQCKKATSNKVSFTIKKLKKNNKYFVRVRAYNQGANGKKVYGKWSTVKKVKVKK